MLVHAAVETIVARKRKEWRIHRALQTFVKECKDEAVNKKCIESLIKAGAFDELCRN